MIVPALVILCLVQAVYTVLREAEDRSVAPIPVWEIPIWKDISPKLKKVNAALKLINDTLDDLIALCKVIYLFGSEINLNYLLYKFYCCLDDKNNQLA